MMFSAVCREIWEGEGYSESHGQGKVEKESWGSVSKKGMGHQVGKTPTALPFKKPQRYAVLIRMRGQCKSVV